MRLLLPLVLGCAFLPGLVPGPRAGLSALPPSPFRVLYWAPLPPLPLAHVAAGYSLVGAPIAFFAFGLTLARTPLAPDRDVWAAVALRLGLSPLLLLATTPFVAVPRAFLVQASMATSLSSLSFAG